MSAARSTASSTPLKPDQTRRHHRHGGPCAVLTACRFSSLFLSPRREKEELEKFRQERPKIQQQFSDLKVRLWRRAAAKVHAAFASPPSHLLTCALRASTHSATWPT